LTRLEKIIRLLNRWASWLAGGALVAMMALTVGNMFLRAIYLPFGGTAEIVSFLAVIVAAFALGYTQLSKGHVAVDIVVSRFPRRAQAAVDTLSSFLAMILFAVAAWRAAVFATHQWQIGALSGTLFIIFYPFIYLLAFGCVLLSLVLLLDFIKSLTQAVKK